MRLSKLAFLVPLAAIVLAEACMGDDPDPVNGANTNDGGTTPAAADGGADGTTTPPDADLPDAPTPPRCDPTQPFGTPVPVKGNDLNTSGN